MSDDFVDDDELLYRRVAASRNLYKIKDDGTIEISSPAFGDRDFKIGAMDRFIRKLECRLLTEYSKGSNPSRSRLRIARMPGITRNTDKIRSPELSPPSSCR